MCPGVVKIVSLINLDRKVGMTMFTMMLRLEIKVMTTMTISRTTTMMTMLSKEMFKEALQMVMG